MQKANIAPSAAEESLFGFMEGKAPEPKAGGSEVILDEVPAAVHASLTVESIMAEAVAKLERRKAEIEAQAAAHRARMAEAEAQAKRFEDEADATGADARAAYARAKAVVAKSQGCLALIPDDSVAYAPAAKSAPKAGKKAA